MRVVIAGGTGFLGKALRHFLTTCGHEVIVLTRTARGPQDVAWTPDGTAGAWASALDGADAIVNLAGAGIADARWTTARKAALHSSRTLSTRSLVTACQTVAKAPAVMVNASGVGYYGYRGSEVVTEAAAPGRDFLAQLCAAWEAEAQSAEAVTRVVRMRNGVVLHPEGGALAKMLLPFRMGVGGRLGSGKQYLSWIHLSDWVELTSWLITTGDARGAFNATAPAPATNADFTTALGAALHRPTVVPVPGFALRMAFGELADTLLEGQRAVPRRAEDMGFTFRFTEIGPALRDLLK